MARCRMFAFMLLLAFSNTGFPQACVTPIPLISEGSYLVDTCISGDAGPVDLCGGNLSAGNAVVFRLYLQYPVGDVFSITPDMTSTFDPAIAVRRHDCLGAGDCAVLVDTAPTGQSESFQLYSLDSGDYDVIVTSFNLDASCGKALVSVNDGLCGCTQPGDGIFISNFDF